MKGRKATDAGSAHQHGDGVVTDDDAVPECQLGMDAGRAVGAERVSVNLGDDVGQPGVADGPGRRRPGPPLVVGGPRRVEDL